METTIEQLVGDLYQSWCGEKLSSIEKLPQSGSDRQYFRIKGASKQVLAAYNNSKNENKAFVDYTTHFRTKGVPLPEIYAKDLEKGIYLLQDLGDVTLLQFLDKNRTAENAPNQNVIEKYKQALAQLAVMQIKGIEGLEVANYQDPVAFDKQNMLWDLNYFKYCFLKQNKVEFDESLLEKDFHTLAAYLSEDEPSFFMFRDFQARNIMLKEEDVFFIDYQGGKLGALQYDVVSLLFQAKANLPNDLREKLLDYYIQEAQKYTAIDVKKFKEKYYAFVLIRTLQVLGAYGFKGYYEKKAHFISSIPFAIQNLKWLLAHISFPIEISNLLKVLSALVESQKKEKIIMKADKLLVRVKSFSYRHGIPEDPSGNGGGFVFDCRFIHNPGRYEPYKKLTGRDAPVIKFLKEQSTIEAFAKNVQQIITEAVENYIERGFASLCINFGCTGGQHRSVFCADYIANYLKDNYSVDVELYHREQERKNWIN